MDHIKIRLAVPGDERVLAHIQTESWKAAFADILPPEELARCTDPDKATEMYRQVLARHFCHNAILYVDGKPHCISAWGKNRSSLEDSVGELICIHSLRDNWAKGYGSAMMAYVLDFLRQEQYESVILWVFKDNRRARRFYEKHGFAPTGQQKETNGIVEIMYRKNF